MYLINLYFLISFYYYSYSIFYIQHSFQPTYYYIQNITYPTQDGLYLYGVYPVDDTHHPTCVYRIQPYIIRNISDHSFNHSVGPIPIPIHILYIVISQCTIITYTIFHFMNINHNNILIYDLYSLYSSLFFDISCINEYSIFYIQQSHLPYLILYIVHDIIYHIYHSYFMNINHQIRLLYNLYVSHSSLIFDIICIIITPYSRQHYHSNLANIRMVVYIITCIIFCVMNKNPKIILIYD